METMSETSPATNANVASAIEVDNNKCVSNRGNGGGRFRNKSGIHSSYAQLITMAINGTDDKRLTLSEIYEWMTKNVPGLYEQRFLHSSKGWKNAVRHTLSINPRFYIISRLGRPGWWALDAKFPKSRTAAELTAEHHQPGAEPTAKCGCKSGSCDVTPKTPQRNVADQSASSSLSCHKSDEFNFDFQVVEVRDIEQDELNPICSTASNSANARTTVTKDTASQTDVWMGKKFSMKTKSGKLTKRNLDNVKDALIMLAQNPVETAKIKHLSLQSKQLKRTKRYLDDLKRKILILFDKKSPEIPEREKSDVSKRTADFLNDVEFRKSLERCYRAGWESCLEKIKSHSNADSNVGRLLPCLRYEKHFQPDLASMVFRVESVETNFPPNLVEPFTGVDNSPETKTLSVNVVGGCPTIFGSTTVWPNNLDGQNYWRPW